MILFGPRHRKKHLPDIAIGYDPDEIGITQSDQEHHGSLSGHRSIVDTFIKSDRNWR